MEITTRIDWYSASSKNKVFPQFPNIFSDDFKATSGLQGYQQAYIYDDGRMVGLSPNQGSFVQYSGSVLNRLSLDPVEIIAYHKRKEFKTTRIDLAIDCKESGLKLKSLLKAMELGEHKTRAKKFGEIKENDGGHTIYIGSRNSEAFMRIYDKGIESKRGGDWIRIEIQFGDSKAVNATNAILSGVNFSDFVVGCIKSYCDFPSHMVWQKIMKAEKVKVKSDKQKEGSTREWILSQVAHAIAKTYLEGDTEIIQDLYKELTEILKNR